MSHNTASKVVNAGVDKAKEIEEKISENLPSNTKPKVVETDKKSDITTKANEALASSANAFKNFDERNNISKTASHIVQDASDKAKDIEHGISANVSKAYTSGANAISAGVSTAEEFVTKATTKPKDHDTDKS